MAYPGNPELSPQAQERVMTAFRQVVGKLQDGNREEAVIGLEFVLRLDPAYAPALSLHEQLSSGAAEVNLDEILSKLQAPTTETINSLLVEAVEDFNNCDFAAARKKVDQVLLELPGHQEARQLLNEIESETSDSPQVTTFLNQALEALERGESQEAANFVMMAQALDPHHRDIATTIAQIEAAGEVSMAQAGFVEENVSEDTVEFAPSDGAEPAFGAAEAASEMFADAGTEEPAALVAEDGGGTAETAEFPSIEAPSTSAFDDAPLSPTPSITAPEKPDYEETVADVSDLFEGPPASPAGDTEAADDGGVDDKIRKLLARGGTAAAADDFAAAIDGWSKVFLIDPGHEEAHDRIEHIRHAKEELDRRIEPMLADALDAHESGNDVVARDFIDRILELSPLHVEATRLAEDYGSSGPAETGMPELEDDLFNDDFSTTADFGADLDQPSTSLEGEWRTPKKLKRRMGWRWWAIIGTAGALVVVFSLWVASALMPEKAPPEERITVVNRVLIEAAELYNKGQVSEAIVLLEQNSAQDVFQSRIDNRLDGYRKKIATPVPTPVPAGLAACRALVAEGRWMAAYQRVKRELKQFPNDPGLEKVRLEILEIEPEAATLHSAVASRDFRAAIAISRDLLEQRPDDAEVLDFYERTLFNAGVTELRAFNLPQSEKYLQELAVLQPDDEEVRRVLEFVEIYKSRPVDMQLDIFVGSIGQR